MTATATRACSRPPRRSARRHPHLHARRERVRHGDDHAQVKDNGGTANGGVDASATQSFTITVTAVNDPPVAANDSATVAEDDSPGVLIDVLANDSTGPANESGRCWPSTRSRSRQLTEQPPLRRGKIRYTPEADYFGPDSFTYKACDNGTTNGVADPKCDTATVNVTVTEVNDPPVAATDTASVAEDSASGVLIDVRANDSKGPANETGQTLTVDSVVSGPASRRYGRRLGADPVHAHRRRLLRARLLHLQGVRQRHHQRRRGSQM